MTETVQFVLRHGYAILFLCVLAEQTGLPVPSVPILLAMGALAGTGQFSFTGSLLLGLCACLLADNFWYWLGIRRGASILNLLCKISLEPDSCVRRTENMFLKFGARGLLFAKFVPGLSTAACPLAGMFRMPLWKFWLFDGAGALFWAGAYISLGYLFRDQLEVVAQKLIGMGSWLLATVITALAAYILWKWYERKRFYKELHGARISPQDLRMLMENGRDVVIVDLRSALEWEEEDARKIPGALHMAYEEVESRMHEIPLDRDLVLYCT